MVQLDMWLYHKNPFEVKCEYGTCTYVEIKHLTLKVKMKNCQSKIFMVIASYIYEVAM